MNPKTSNATNTPLTARLARRSSKAARVLAAGSLAVGGFLGATAGPAAAASDITMGVLDNCGSEAVKTTLWGQWQQHSNCSVTNIDISPNGQDFAAIGTDGALLVKQGLWGQWQQHLGPGDAKDVAMGPNGMVGAVTGCGAAYIKTSLGGQWQQHTPCGSVLKLDISPDGNYFAIINADRSLAVKQGLWGQWQTHIGANDTKDVSLGPAGVIGLVNGCGGVYVKTSLWGQWQQHMGCASASALDISPDAQTFAVLGQDGAVHAKQGLWGQWQTHVGAGSAKGLAVAASTPASAPAGTAVDLAKTILANDRVALATVHQSGIRDGADARSNIVDTSNGLRAKRSSYLTAPGGTTDLDSRVLRGILSAAGSAPVRVSEIAGAEHSVGSSHYAGRAVDFDMVDGALVSSRTNYMKIVDACKASGATQVLHPGNDRHHQTHVHCGW